MMDAIEKLRGDFAALALRVAALEAKVLPPAPVDDIPGPGQGSDPVVGEESVS
jgi:hypothetical protein